MRHRLAEWLHPAAWTEERLAVAGRVVAVLAVSLLVAWICGLIFSRWFRRGAAPADEKQVDELSRLVRRVVLLIGLYEAARNLPLQPLAASVTTGLLFALAVLAGARLTVRSARLVLRAYVDRAAEGAARDRASREYLPLASAATTVGVALLAVIVVAHHFGHDVSSLVTAFGVGSLAIGLAAQQTLGNMIAGFTLLIDRPFGPGDQVKLQSGESGEVTDIGIRSTKIMLPEGNLLIVPNSELANTRVVNRSYPAASARCEVRLRVGWDADVERMSELLADLAHAQPEALTRPEPKVTLSALDSKGLELVLAFRVGSAEEREPVEERVRRQLVKRLVEGDAVPEGEAPPAESDAGKTTRSKI